MMVKMKGLDELIVILEDRGGIYSEEQEAAWERIKELARIGEEKEGFDCG